MQQYNEGDIADGPNGPLVFTGGAWRPMGNGAQTIISKPADPTYQYQGPKAAVDLEAARQAAARAAQMATIDAAKVPYAPRQAAADTTKAEADAQKAQLELQNAQRQAALPVAGQTGRANLQRAIDDIRAKYAAGPGQTSGLSGLMDYLPTTANQQFDAAGNAVRGFVGPALGLTGGQLNTEKEAQRAVGPYIPQSGDRDAVILDKIRRLQGLADAMKPAGQKQAQNGQQSQQVATVAAGAGSVPPSGPAGYDVAGVAGGVGAPGGGGGFTDAAGLMMATRLKDAYNKGATVADLNQLLVSNGYQPFSDAAAIEAINKRGPLNFAPPAVDDTRGSVGRAVGDAVSAGGIAGDIGAYAANATNALTGNNLDSLAGGQTGMALDYASQRSPIASNVGSLVGSTAASAASELGLGALAARAGLGASPWIARGADALYGAISGAGQADGPNDSRLTGALLGGAGGVAGGIAGRGFARGVGNVLGGVQNADVQGLRAAGIPMTAGQAVSQSGTLGRAAQALENATTGIPGVGAVTRGRYTDSFEGLNRAAFDEALTPIQGNTNGVVREQGVDLARRARSRAYSNALDPVRVQADAPFVTDMQAAVNAGRALPEPMRGNMDYTLPTRVGQSFDNNGNMTGNDFQQAIRGLRRDARAVESQPYGYDFGNVTNQAEGALEGLLQRQSPGTLPAYRAANEANRRIEILKDAVNRARNGTTTGDPGLFSAAQLADAAAANAKRFGGNQGTTQQPFYDLTRAAQRILPSKVADSGTATRAAVTAALGVGAGGGAGYAAGDTEGAGLGAGGTLALAGLLAAGGSRAGQRAITSALLNRPDALIQLGNQVRRQSRIGGIFGAPMLAGASGFLAAP